MVCPALSQAVEFLLNGQAVAVRDLPVQTTLLDYLRSRGLTGAKEGCAEGECGACTVMVVAQSGVRTTYRAVNSCLMFLPMLHGQEVYSVEALAERGELSEAQSAMAAMGGSQCGYCTPGFVVSLFAEQYRPDRAGACDVRQLAGNLCRCSAYRAIQDAALSLGKPAGGAFLERLNQPAPSIAPHAYAENGARFSRPSSIEECIGLSQQDPKAGWISGSTDLGVESNLRFRRWPHLISLEAVAELREFSVTEDGVSIGAALNLTEIAQQWVDAPEAFREWLILFASPVLRNRATLGGNLATASPIGDGAPLLLALDARLRLAGPSGRRGVPLAEFFTGYRKTVLGAHELIAAIEVPRSSSLSRFYKVAKRRFDDISTVAAGFTLKFDANRRIESARFAFGGVAATPVRVRAAEEAVSGSVWDLDAVHRVQAILHEELHPISDHRGSAVYRLEVAKSLIKKFWWETQQ